MAVIERIRDMNEWGKLLRVMDRAELIAQQLVQRGALDAVEFLVENGGTAEVTQKMLDSLKEGLMTIHEIARQRGIELVGYEDPGDDSPMVIAATAAEKYQVLRTIGICDGTLHFRITDAMDAAIEKALRERPHGT